MSAMREWLQQGNYSCFREAYQVSARVHWEAYGTQLLHIACQEKPEALGTSAGVSRPMPAACWDRPDARFWNWRDNLAHVDEKFRDQVEGWI